MHTTALVLSVLLAVSISISASGKLRRDPKVIAIMEHVGLSAPQIKALAFVEIAGAVGLLATSWLPDLGVLAAGGVTLYFVGAVVAHTRKHDPLAETGPAIFLALVAAVTAFAIASAW